MERESEEPSVQASDQGSAAVLKVSPEGWLEAATGEAASAGGPKAHLAQIAKVEAMWYDCGGEARL